MRPAHDRSDALSQPALLEIPRALELLEARGLAPTVVRYLEPAECRATEGLLGKLGISARQLLRTGEEEYKPSTWQTRRSAKHS